MAKVMVVDNNEAVLHVLVRSVELCGVSVRTALDGTTAASMLSSRCVDLLISAVYIPGMDGVSLVRL